MLSILEIAIFNAVLVIPLALVAVTSARLFRRPPLTHLLWVLVLVKLLTPPIWQIPLIDGDWLNSSGRQFVSRILSHLEHPQWNVDLRGTKEPVAGANGQQTSRPRTLAARDAQAAAVRVSFFSQAARWLRSEESRYLMVTGFLVIWSIGALVWFSVQGFRCVRFSLILKQGYPADADFQRFSDRLARRIGLSYSPTVWLMPGVLSPMLWGTGESLLLIFPERMLNRLNASATATLLTHELAHCRRRDHWVRVIALLATGFFWWHPVVWWARREIEASEEECCDALVVSRSQFVPKCYAEAILDVIDFLAQTSASLPALATGLGQVPFLRQRLTWIMRGPRRQEFGRTGWFVCAILLCLLPLQPSWLSTGIANVGALPPPPRNPDRMANALVTPMVLPAEPKRANALDSDAQLISDAETEISQRWSGFEVMAHSLNSRFVILGNKSSLFLFDFQEGREFDLGDFRIQSMSFVRNSTEFVTIGDDCMLRIWDAQKCEVTQAWQVPVGNCKSVDVSGDGEWIATGGRDGIVRIWNRSSAQSVHELPRELAPVNCVRFSHDQSQLAVSTGESMTTQTGRIAILNTENWSEQISMNWNAPAAAVLFSEDGQSLISGDARGRVARWNVSTGEMNGISEGHFELMAAAEFSPSGSPLAGIEVPDLPTDTDWKMQETSDGDRWFLRGWMQPAVVPVIQIDSARP